MANFQYKSSSAGSWADIPRTAYWGTLSGTLLLQTPSAEEYDVTGRRCGAIGKPSILLKSVLMGASGMEWWQSFFATTNDVDKEFWLTVLNPRNNTWEKYTGYLARPRWSRLQIGSASVNTYYEDFEISLENVSVTT